MATLSSEVKDGIWKAAMSGASCDCFTGTLTKDQIRSAIDELDTWLGSNSAAIEGVFGVGVKAGMSQRARWRLLVSIASARAESEVF